MKTRIVLLAMAAGALLSQSIFAIDSKPCMVVAKACVSAGYTRMDKGDKKIWMNCMKPILMGHEAKGVTIDPQVVKECRANKINMLKVELKDLESVK